MTKVKILCLVASSDSDNTFLIAIIIDLYLFGMLTVRFWLTHSKNLREHQRIEVILMDRRVY